MQPVVRPLPLRLAALVCRHLYHVFRECDTSLRREFDEGLEQLRPSVVLDDRSAIDDDGACETVERCRCTSVGDSVPLMLHGASRAILHGQTKEGRQQALTGPPGEQRI